MTGGRKPTIFRATDQWFASVAGFRRYHEGDRAVRTTLILDVPIHFLLLV
jgi:isoleucyl-tRNA synthetase